jgi:hypothetical protein
MTKLLAGVFAGISMMFGGLFGHHAAPASDMGSTTPNHWNASSTPMNGEGTTTPGHMGMMPGVMGVVASINGTTLTVTGRTGDSATTTYTVDASSAMVLKSTSGKVATSTLSAVVAGDKVMVEGTVSGTSITAKTILDGLIGFGGGDMHGGMKGGMPQGMHMTHTAPSTQY